MRQSFACLLFLSAAAPAGALLQAARVKSPKPSALRAPPVVLGLGPIAASAAIIGAGNVVGYGLTVATRSQYHVDLVGTGLFAVSALALRGASGFASMQGISAAAIALWSIKLAGFLLYRVIGTGHDARLDDLLGSPGPAAGFWVGQFMWGFVVSLPHTLAAAVPTAVRPAFGAVHGVGLGMYAAGLIIETVADAQKWAFKASNPGAFCNAGLWGLSQHPNWFGNLLLWTGLLVYNAPTLLARQGEADGLVARGLRLGLASLSPILLWLLFGGQAGGSLGPGVELANAKYGGDKKYLDYVGSVPLIVPKIGQVLGRLFGGGS